MNAVAKMRQAGFIPALSPAGGLLIEPASKLTPEQRAYIRAHKVLLLEELRAEIAGKGARTDLNAVRRFSRDDAGEDLIVAERGQLKTSDAENLADRIAELLALGWAPWNARARAESEALPAWREKMEVGK